MEAQKLLNSFEEQVCCQACSQHSKDQSLLRTRLRRQNASQQQMRRHCYCNERLIEPTEPPQQDQKMVDRLLKGLRYQPDKEEHIKCEETPIMSAREIVTKEIWKYKEKTATTNQQIEKSLKHIELLQKTVDKFTKEIAQNEAIVKYFEECCQSSDTTQLLKLGDDITALKQINVPDSQYELVNEVSGHRKDSGIHSRSSSMESNNEDITSKVFEAIKTNSHRPLCHTRESMSSECSQSEISSSGTDSVLASNELVESPNTDNQSIVTEKSDGLHVSTTATWYTTASFLTKTIAKTKLKRATRGPQLVAEVKVQTEALEWYDNETLIINSGDEGVMRYALNCQQLGQSFSDDSRSRTCLAISKRDNLAFTVDQKSNLQVYDLHVDKLLKRIQLPVGKYSSATVVDEKLVLCDNQNECLRVYDISRGKLTQKKFKGTVICNSDLRKPWSVSSLANGVVVACRPTDQPKYMFHMDLSGTVLWKYCSVLDPWGITADSQKRVFVCNRKFGEIFMFDSNTMGATTAITTERLGYGYEPIELAIWNDTLAVYISNGKTKAVKLFDISSLQ